MPGETRTKVILKTVDDENPNYDQVLVSVTVGSVKNAFNRMLDAATLLAFPEYRNSLEFTHNKSQRIKVNSSLELHMMLYFNVLFSIIWFIAMLNVETWKKTYFQTSSLFQYLTMPMVYFTGIVEILRVYLGLIGNGGESVPSLMGCFVLSIIPQFIFCVYFLAIQSTTDFTMPIEYALNVIFLLFLIPEVYFTFNTAKMIIKSQAQEFFLSMSKE